MKHKLHIAYRNREDMLLDAVGSVRDIGCIHLWPNNGAADVDLPDVTKHRLPEMLTTGVINMMVQESWDDDVMFWAHNDMFCPPGVAKQFYEKAVQKFNSNEKWGVLFSTYDVLCCFNMKMYHDVGYWDPFFPQYVSDVDFYRRMTLRGWSEEYFLKDVVEHRSGSSSIKADPLFNYRTQCTIGAAREYYNLKWGGAQGHEKYKTPFYNFYRRQP